MIIKLTIVYDENVHNRSRHPNKMVEEVKDYIQIYILDIILSFLNALKIHCVCILHYFMISY